MALVTSFVCVECKENKFEVVYRDKLCFNCRDRINKHKRESHLSYLKQLPIEARIAKIEAILYDLNAEERLSAIESATQTYC